MNNPGDWSFGGFILNGDGFGSAASGGADCDDNDAGRWPGKTEVGDSTYGGGLDCDDSNQAVVLGSMVCEGKSSVKVCKRGLFVSAPCAKGLQCYPQPNGLGVCAPASTSLPEREPSSAKK